MNIQEKKINYINGLPCEAELCNITAAEPHYHSKDIELIYCIEGSIELVAGHQRVTINAGEIYSVDYRDIHYLRSDNDNLVLIFHLDLTTLDISWDNFKHVFFACESNHCYPYQQKAMEKTIEIILSIAHSLHSENASSFTKEDLVRTSNELMDMLFKYFNWYNYENHDEYMNVDLYNRYQRILAYCNENYMNKISISHLAKHEHINVNYFSQFINKTVFENFNNMIKYIRCYEAEQLLLKTDLPIAEISYTCGFSDPKYFYAAFKTWWNCTPTEHRNFYKAYLENTSDVSVIKGADAVEIIESAITKWMLKKTLGSKNL